MKENVVWKEGAAWAAKQTGGPFLGHFRFKKEATQATEHSGHEVRVDKYKAGWYPIAGWNWPIWGYRVTCSCGYRSGNVAGDTQATVKMHLEYS